MNNVWDEFARYVFNVEIEVEQEDGRRPQAWGASSNATATGGLNYQGGHAAAGSEAIAAAAGAPAGIAEAAEFAAEAAAELPAPVETRRVADEEKVGRNDPCWCGSGKKFKKCHGA
jgi:preprotein translocase subunit SecA